MEVHSTVQILMYSTFLFDICCKRLFQGFPILQDDTDVPFTSLFNKKLDEHLKDLKST